VNRIRESYARSPPKSLSRGSRELSIPQTTAESHAQRNGYETSQATAAFFLEDSVFIIIIIIVVVVGVPVIIIIIIIIIAESLEFY
jgi:hypothetical protein